MWRSEYLSHVEKRTSRMARVRIPGGQGRPEPEQEPEKVGLSSVLGSGGCDLRDAHSCLLAGRQARQVLCWAGLGSY